MRIKIGHTWFDHTAETPVLLELNEGDVQRLINELTRVQASRGRMKRLDITLVKPGTFKTDEELKVWMEDAG